MGYLGFFYEEAKSFELCSDEREGVRLVEWSKRVFRSITLAWPTILWLVTSWDSLLKGEESRESWRSFRFGNMVYVLQRRRNQYGIFMELSKYGGGGRSSFVIIPEGCDGKGWKECYAQLQGLKLHHEKQHAAGTPVMAGKQVVQTKWLYVEVVVGKNEAKERHVKSRVCRTNQKEHLK